MQLPAFLTDTIVLGTTPLRWLLGLAVVVVVYTVLTAMRARIRTRLARRSPDRRLRTADLLFELLGATRNWTLLVVAVYAAIFVLAIDPITTRRITQVLVILFLVQAAIWANQTIAFVIRRYAQDETIDSSRRTSLSALAFVGRLVIFSLLLLMALDNLGINITTLIAGLGIGSVAVALAVQGILTDLFASLSIVFDKPFELGDFIAVDDLSGTVDNIGLRTTRLISLSGEQLVFANNDLLSSRIHNYKRMEERRVAFTLGVEYGTPREKLEQIPGIIRQVLEELDDVRFDRSHFSGFGEYSLDFETVYYVLSRDYALYMEVQQKLYLELYGRIAELGVAFALPTRTVDLRQEQLPPKMAN